MKTKTEPKITIEVIDNAWVVNRGKYLATYSHGKEVVEAETRIFYNWNRVIDYLKKYLTH